MSTDRVNYADKIIPELPELSSWLSALENPGQDN